MYLPRDPENVNAMKQTCAISVLAFLAEFCLRSSKIIKIVAFSTLYTLTLFWKTRMTLTPTTRLYKMLIPGELILYHVTLR